MRLNPELLWWKLIVKMVDNCSIEDGGKQTNRFQGEYIVHVTYILFSIEGLHKSSLLSDILPNECNEP